MALTLVIGGAASGKSAFAESLLASAEAQGRRVAVVATAQPLDAEMAARIERHRAARPPRWRVVEAPLDLAGAIDAIDAPETTVLVDCLTLWLTNALYGDDGRYEERWSALRSSVARARAEVVAVSNELGTGVVPMGAETRRFVELHGRMNETLMRAADRGFYVVAGRALALKP